MWSKSANENFHMTSVVFFSAAYSVTPLLLIIPVKRLNMSVIVGCGIGGSHVTSAPKDFIDYTLFLKWIFFLDDSIPDLVMSPLVLFYDDCCSHYNDEIVKKSWA